jgi:hypothetical protein
MPGDVNIKTFGINTVYLLFGDRAKEIDNYLALLTAEGDTGTRRELCSEPGIFTYVFL